MDDLSPRELHPGVLHHVVNTLGWSDLRPLQRDAIEPLRSGLDCLLLAPTAGGKTEAAFFPILSEMAEAEWHGLTVLYITPLRALLNNLHPRLSGYSGWVGRRVGLWHGDTGQGERRRILNDLPDVLLTTPESLEAMLVSTGVNHRAIFANVKIVVVDELHAFAGDDRGWHLLSVLERLQQLIGHPIQRVGLTATVGNPTEILQWFQGSGAGRPSQIVSPSMSAPSAPDITLDYVGNIENAAKVISSMHAGEKRLAFTDSRSQAEDLARTLRERGVTTFVSHSSLSADERRISEEAFAEARDCVVVATSTLELGIDVGDLDRVIQIDAPRTVASFLQRLGRTGRRAGTARNCLFLATRESSLLRAAALIHLWSTGFVEAIVAPPHPRHIAAQQFLALALQEREFGMHTWREWWGNLPVMDDGDIILGYLRAEGFLEEDSGMLFIGPAAERAFGRRNFLELTSVFTADPEFKVLLGRRELGAVSPLTITGAVDPGQPRTLLLAGRTWRVTEIDWRRRTVNVVEFVGEGRSRWSGGTPATSFELAWASRAVLLDADPPVDVSRRAAVALARIRSERSLEVDSGGVVLEIGSAEKVWWTFAGTRANESLAAALQAKGIDASAGAESVVATELDPVTIRDLAQASEMEFLTTIDANALEGLKFSTALPMDLATLTLQERRSDPERARQVASGVLVIRDIR